MRDLGNQSIFSGKKKKLFPIPINRKTITVGVIVVAVLAAGYYFLGGNGSSSGGTSSSAGVTLKDAPTNLKPVTLSGAAKIEGVDLKSQSAVMKNVSDGQASATVTRAYGAGIYRLDVKATLPDPKNTYYEVWLVGGGKTVPVDFMSGSKNSWSLSLTDSDKFSSYNTVWITLERTKDNIPEEHVMEGSF